MASSINILLQIRDMMVGTWHVQKLIGPATDWGRFTIVSTSGHPELHSTLSIEWRCPEFSGVQTDAIIYERTIGKPLQLLACTSAVISRSSRGLCLGGKWGFFIGTHTIYSVSVKARSDIEFSLKRLVSYVPMPNIDRQR